MSVSAAMGLDFRRAVWESGRRTAVVDRAVNLDAAGTEARKIVGLARRASWHGIRKGMKSEVLTSQ